MQFRSKSLSEALTACKINSNSGIFNN